jgi:hypothetical protein
MLACNLGMLQNWTLYIQSGLFSMIFEILKMVLLSGQVVWNCSGFSSGSSSLSQTLQIKAP